MSYWSKSIAEPRRRLLQKARRDSQELYHSDSTDHGKTNISRAVLHHVVEMHHYMMHLKPLP